MHTVQYRRWAPAQSPVTIEFPASLLREIRVQVEQDHERGMLFGSARMAAAVGGSSIGDIRAVTARRSHEAPQVGGMELVGVYICRARGEVFLTDDDLLYMDQMQAPMALVMAGARAGFFVRQRNGAIQAVRSFEEFAVADATPIAELTPRKAVPPPAPVASRKFPWILGLLIPAILGVPIGAVAYLRPLLRDLPIAITLKDDGGQLVAAWDTSAASEGGRLEITDAGVRSAIEIAPGATSAVYQRHFYNQTGNAGYRDTISVKLSAGRRTGLAQWSSPLVVDPTPRREVVNTPAPVGSRVVTTGDAVSTQQQVADLEQQVKKLRMLEANRNAQIVDLSKLTERLLSPKQAKTSPTQLAQWYKQSVNAKPAQ